MKNQFLINGEPTLLLDKKKSISNIKTMAEKAKGLGLSFRPHFKTHQSLLISEWFRDYGTDKITVSSFKMAEYFAEYGWNDITVAFPVNFHEIDKINRLAEKIKLNVLVESEETVEFLNKNLIFSVDVFIKLDTGYHRTGISSDDTDTLEKIAEKITKSDMMRFAGFLTHAGHSYDVKGRDAIVDLHKKIVSQILRLRAHFEPAYPELIVSVGDTPTCSVAEEFSGIDEIRPGNFVFYDLKQAQIGSCKTSQISVAMAVPVVAKHEERNEIVVYGGAVHFSKEFILTSEGNPVYGKVVKFSLGKWEDTEDGIYLVSLSQEHGIIRGDDKFIKNTHVGDVLLILPVHSCLTANLMKKYMTLNGEIIERL